MKIRTEKEIVCKFLQTWDSLCLENVSAYNVNNKEWRVSITSRSDEPLPMKLKYLMDLAEFFGTRNIDEEHWMSNKGCSTCGYNAAYSYTFTIKPEEE